ncbi:MAG: hypothetical protein UGF89_00270 [Acutalibacteraceae bacterium]|nr:hypothetical protein [Acutalibacteraceae bacterium]
MLIVSQALISVGAKEKTAVVGGIVSSLSDFLKKAPIRNFIKKHPVGTVFNVSYTVFGYGAGDEKFDADSDEANYIEKLIKKEPDTFNELSKQIGSGEFTEASKEEFYE